MRNLFFKISLFPRRWPCFAVGFVNGGDEFVLHLYLVCFTIRWGQR